MKRSSSTSTLSSLGTSSASQSPDAPAWRERRPRCAMARHGLEAGDAWPSTPSSRAAHIEPPILCAHCAEPLEAEVEGDREEVEHHLTASEHPLSLEAWQRDAPCVASAAKVVASLMTLRRTICERRVRTVRLPRERLSNPVVEYLGGVVLVDRARGVDQRGARLARGVA